MLNKKRLLVLFSLMLAGSLCGPPVWRGWGGMWRKCKGREARCVRSQHAATWNALTELSMVRPSLQN